MAIHSSGQTIFSFSYMEGNTLAMDEGVNEVAREENSMDRIGEVSDRANEGQVAGVYGTGFTAGFLTRKGVRCEERDREQG